MNTPLLKTVNWLFSHLVPAAVREPLLGDLLEEHALRERMGSRGAALAWYLRQIALSTPSLLWIRITQMRWPATLGVSVLAYLTVGVAQVIVQWMIPRSSAPACHVLGGVLVFPIVGLIAYLAEGLRHRAAWILSGMMLLAMTAMTLWVPENVPLWYRLVYFLAGPAMALTGGWLQSRQGQKGPSHHHGP